MNWSTGKKFLVTFLICLLTFSVYIGSAIYSAGTQGVMERFGVSQVAATLGLTLFVAGYGEFHVFGSSSLKFLKYRAVRGTLYWQCPQEFEALSFLASLDEK